MEPKWGINICNFWFSIDKYRLILLYIDIVYLWIVRKEASVKMASWFSSLLFFFDGSLSSSNKSSSSGGDETDFLTMRCVPADGWRMSDMLLITTTMGMIYGIHSDSSNSGPSSAFCLVFVVLATGLANWLVWSSTSSANSDHSSAITWNGSSAATWESNSGLVTIIRVTDDNSWCSTCSSKRSSVSCLSFTIGNNSSFGK